MYCTPLLVIVRISMWIRLTSEQVPRLGPSPLVSWGSCCLGTAFMTIHHVVIDHYTYSLRHWDNVGKRWIVPWYQTYWKLTSEYLISCWLLGCILHFFFSSTFSLERLMLFYQVFEVWILNLKLYKCNGLFSLLFVVSFCPSDQTRQGRRWVKWKSNVGTAQG